MPYLVRSNDCDELLSFTLLIVQPIITREQSCQSLCPFHKKV